MAGKFTSSEIKPYMEAVDHAHESLPQLPDWVEEFNQRKCDNIFSNFERLLDDIFFEISVYVVDKYAFEQTILVSSTKKPPNKQTNKQKQQQ